MKALRVFIAAISLGLAPASALAQAQAETPPPFAWEVARGVLIDPTNPRITCGNSPWRCEIVRVRAVARDCGVAICRNLDQFIDGTTLAIWADQERNYATVSGRELL